MLFQTAPTTTTNLCFAGDEYVPQMSQMADYSMAQMGGPQQPQQQRYPPGMPMNPYEQQQHHQQMMMMQQQHMHMAGQQQQAQAAAQPPPPAKKPRGKSKKAQAAEAAAAAAAAAAANQMDPMASMAAMSNNPMMRQNAYPVCFSSVPAPDVIASFRTRWACTVEHTIQEQVVLHSKGTGQDPRLQHKANIHRRTTSKCTISGRHLKPNKSSRPIRTVIRRRHQPATHHHNKLSIHRKPHHHHSI